MSMGSQHRLSLYFGGFIYQKTTFVEWEDWPCTVFNWAGYTSRPVCLEGIWSDRKEQGPFAVSLYPHITKMRRTLTLGGGTSFMYFISFFLSVSSRGSLTHSVARTPTPWQPQAILPL